VIRRATLVGLAAPFALAAQLQLSIVEGSGEKPTGPEVNVGVVRAGDFRDVEFRIRNLSAFPIWLNGLNLSGFGYSFLGELPQLPKFLTSGATVGFVLRFHPLTRGLYTAYLNVNGVRTTLSAEAIVTAQVALLDATGKTVLTPGDTTDFGAAEKGLEVARQFELSNPGAETVSVNLLAVTGAAFRATAGLPLAAELKPAQTALFEVVFAPAAVGGQQGTLDLDGLIFPLRGTGLEPTLPKPVISVEPQVLRGGQQAKVSVRLASTARTSGSGTLTLDLHPSVSGKATDSSLLFPATGSRSIGFAVAMGEDSARFGGGLETEFQTGTTAGTLVLTARLGPHTEQLSLVVPAGPPVVDTARATRLVSGVDVRVTGFDTSRSVARLAFTFIDHGGRMVAPGAIEVNVIEPFRQYFEGTDFGGMFALRAVFPVTGDPANLVSVEVELLNSYGPIRTARVPVE
jgi:hypothetical protein